MKICFLISKSLDVPLLADRISRIERDYPCARFEKVMKYLLHLKAPHTLKAQDFKSLGLYRILQREEEKETRSLELCRHRINSTIYFDSYSGKEMVNIIHKMAGLSSLTMPASKDRAIEEFFEVRGKCSDFGNGREARILLEQCERQVARRVSKMDPEKVTASDLNIITDKDVEEAIRDLKEKRISERGQLDALYGFA